MVLCSLLGYKKITDAVGYQHEPGFTAWHTHTDARPSSAASTPLRHAGAQLAQSQCLQMTLEALSYRVKPASGGPT